MLSPFIQAKIGKADFIQSDIDYSSPIFHVAYVLECSYQKDGKTILQSYMFKQFNFVDVSSIWSQTNRKWYRTEINLSFVLEGSPLI